MCIYIYSRIYSMCVALRQALICVTYIRRGAQSRKSQGFIAKHPRNIGLVVCCKTNLTNRALTLKTSTNSIWCVANRQQASHNGRSRRRCASKSVQMPSRLTCISFSIPSTCRAAPQKMFSSKSTSTRRCSHMCDVKNTCLCVLNRTKSVSRRHRRCFHSFTYRRYFRS